MRSPKAAKEDPKVVAQREREQRRAENARTEETQALLIGATQRRLRRFGSIAGRGGAVPIYGAAPGRGTTGGGTGGSTGGGGFGGGGRQIVDVDTPNMAMIY